MSIIFPLFNLIVQYCRLDISWLIALTRHHILKCVKSNPFYTSAEFSSVSLSYPYISLYFPSDFFLASRLPPRSSRGRRHIFMLNRDFEIRYCSPVWAYTLWREVRTCACIRCIRILRAGAIDATYKVPPASKCQETPLLSNLQRAV